MGFEIMITTVVFVVGSKFAIGYQEPPPPPPPDTVEPPYREGFEIKISVTVVGVSSLKT